MANPDSIALAASAEAEGLQAVLVGGNAVNLYSYFRTTFDVDLLVRETDSERWLSYFQKHGYAPFHRTANFIRLRFVAHPAEALPVDLMLADARTFTTIQRESRRCDIGNGLSLAIPSPLHLIAMKLHALRSPARFENGIDLQDVKYLIKTAKIDTARSSPTSPSVMPPTPYESKSSENSAKNRVRENGATLALPQFDSLPATAGLNNTEAFRLSIRHALALLPAMFAKGMDERPGENYPDRFTID